MYVIVMILCCQCQQQNQSVTSELRLFNPSYDLNYNDLIKLGFKEIVGVDVLMVKKKLNDSTTVYFTFEDSLKEVLTEHWEIRFNEFSPESVAKFMEEHYASIVTPLCLVEDPLHEFVDQYSFFVQNKHTGAYFRCTYSDAPENGEIWLEIDHDYPRSWRREFTK
jgi:hypothetical protein